MRPTTTNSAERIAIMTGQPRSEDPELNLGKETIADLEPQEESADVKGGRSNACGGMSANCHGDGTRL
jgi:hypothetical protein